jgi:hypothetical protein
MLAFHRRQKRVEILFALYLENRRRNSYLHILHPGNTEYELIRRPWPLPAHLREGDAKPNILESIYGGAFQLDGQDGSLHQTNGLTAWDSLFAYAGKRAVAVWPDRDPEPASGHMTRIFPDGGQDEKGFVPFSEFRLGPFTRVGPVLIGFRLWFEGESYLRLLGNRSTFTVDGPESLMIRLKREHFGALAESDREKWEKRIRLFEEYVGFGESYDVIVLGRPLASAVTCTWRNGIVKAPIQPTTNVAERYITAYPRFVLALEYSEIATPTGNPEDRMDHSDDALRHQLTRE